MIKIMITRSNRDMPHLKFSDILKIKRHLSKEAIRMLNEAKNR